MAFAKHRFGFVKREQHALVATVKTSVAQTARVPFRTQKQRVAPRRTFAFSYDAFRTSILVAQASTKDEAKKPAEAAESEKPQVASMTATTVPDPFIENLIAGALSRGISQTMLHPADTMRTRLQARGVATVIRSAGDMYRIFSKGITACILLSVPAGGLQFVTYEAMKERLSEWLPGQRALIQLTAGAGGALAASIIRVPQEVLKQRVQADIYPNFGACFKGVMAKEGPRGLYTGYLSTVMRDVPYNALAFLFFEQFKSGFRFVAKRDATDWENLALGGAAGCVSAILCTPIDVVKTRLMTQRAGDTVRYKGIVDTLFKVARMEGPGALMKGVTPRIIYLSPMSAITFAVYEAVKGVLRAKRVAPVASRRVPSRAIRA